MDIRDWYVGQLVTESELDGAFADVETAIHRTWSDTEQVGIVSGFTVSQNTPADLSVDVTGGLARSEYGERIYAPSMSVTNVDCEFDRDSNPTEVLTVGNSRILSIVAFFDRTLADPRTDALNATVYFRRNEFLSYEVVQGDEALTPTPPTIPAGGVRLANITLTYGQTTIVDLNIDDTAHQYLFDHGAGPIIVQEGTLPDAMDAVVGALNQHISGAAYPHAGGDVTYGGPSGFWADGTTKVIATDVTAAITEVVSDLASIDANDSGAQRLGCDEDASSPTTLAAGPLKTRLASMRQAANLSYAGSGSWADASTMAASSVEVAIDTIVSTLAASTAAAKMGMAAVGNFTAGTIQAMIAQLAATTSSNDGAKRIGAQAVAGSYTAGTVRSQLDEVISGTQTITGAKTYDNITASGTNKYKLASRSVPREQTAPLYNSTAGTWSLTGMISIGSSQVGQQILSDLADGATLASVTAWIDPSNDTLMPGTKPTLEVKRRDLQTGTLTTLGSATIDATADGAAYESVHSFSVTGIGEVIDRQRYHYYVTLTGESGANADVVDWYGCVASQTLTSMPEAP